MMSEQSPQHEPHAADFAASILVNGEPHRLPDEASVAGLLEALAMAGRRVAVAVNRDVVPRSSYAGHRLHAGDRVEILEAVGGG
jgi:sulfur carrier protein